jgi:hypothetical protein
MFKGVELEVPFQHCDDCCNKNINNNNNNNNVDDDLFAHLPIDHSVVPLTFKPLLH